IDDEMLLPVLQRALDDPGEAAGPVVAVTRDQPHALALADNDQAVAVVFDLVEPSGARRHRLTDGRDAGRIGASHSRKIVIRNKIQNSRKRPGAASQCAMRGEWLCRAGTVMANWLRKVLAWPSQWSLVLLCQWRQVGVALGFGAFGAKMG